MNLDPEMPLEHKFWEKEEPETVEAHRLIWRFYPKAGKLQITRVNHYRNTGETKYRTIALDRRSVPPEANLLWEKFIGLPTNNEK